MNLSKTAFLIWLPLGFLLLIFLIPGCVKSPAEVNCEEYINREEKSPELYTSCMYSKALYYAKRGDRYLAIKVCKEMKDKVERTFGGGFISKLIGNQFSPNSAFRVYNQCINYVAVHLGDEYVCNEIEENALERYLFFVYEFWNVKGLFMSDKEACRYNVRAEKERESIYKNLWSYIFSFNAEAQNVQ